MYVRTYTLKKYCKTIVNTTSQALYAKSCTIYQDFINITESL